MQSGEARKIGRTMREATQRLARGAVVLGLLLGLASVLGGARAAEAGLDATIEVIASGATIPFANAPPERTNQIPIHGVNKSAVVPFDLRQGKPTGPRHHEPLIVHKRIDAASPSLAKAAASREPIDATIRFYEGSLDTPHLVLQISGATIVAHRTIALPGEPFPVEQVSFVFETIRTTWTEEGVTFSESWSGPEKKSQ